jgi:phospholipase C
MKATGRFGSALRLFSRRFGLSLFCQTFINQTRTFHPNVSAFVLFANTGGINHQREEMRSLFAKFAKITALGIFGAAACAIAAHAGEDRDRDSVRHLDRVFVIVMENHDFDEEIGELNSTGLALLTPFITQLATSYGLETYYFGVTHPSLPNYLAMISGDYFDIQDDNDSCFNPTHGTPCDSVNAPNIVDQLESKNISWEGLFESMPSIGFLGSSFPNDTNRLYAQKHDPFVYFQNIALNPSRLVKLKPFVLSEFQSELADPAAASRFIFIVPNQCSDQHGTGSCNTDQLAQAAGDAFIQQTVPTIINSRSFTERSALFIVWDENDFGGDLGCCGRPGGGGGHIPMIVVTKHGKPLKAATPSDHYSLLATIEDGFGLPRLANAKTAATLFEVFPDFDL